MGNIGSHVDITSRRAEHQANTEGKEVSRGTGSKSKGC
jgi:hypothetical protein